MVEDVAALIHTSSTIWVDPLVILAMMVTIIGAFIAIMRPVRRRGKQLDLFLRDWSGEPERPGVPHRPGVMERLSSLEDQGAAQGSQLAVIHAEVNFNHGGSIKDAVTRVDHKVAEVDAKVELIKDTITDLHGKYIERMDSVDQDIRDLNDRTHIEVNIDKARGPDVHS